MCCLQMAFPLALLVQHPGASGPSFPYQQRAHFVPVPLQPAARHRFIALGHPNCLTCQQAWSRWLLPVTAALAEGTRFGGCLLVPELTNVPSGCQDVNISSCHWSDWNRLPHCQFSGSSGAFGINISRVAGSLATLCRCSLQCVRSGLCRCRDRGTTASPGGEVVPGDTSRV